MIIAAADIGMCTDKPHLLDLFAIIPARHWKIGAHLINGHGMKAVFNKVTEFGIGEFKNIQPFVLQIQRHTH